MDSNCDECKAHKIHLDNWKDRRDQYQRDKEKDAVAGTEVVVSADMQKIILLPYMTGIKLLRFYLQTGDIS